MVNSIPDELLLVGNKDVKVIPTTLETSFKDIKQQTEWESYDSTHNASAEKVLWIEFDIENRSKVTVTNYLYSTYDNNTIYQQKEHDFTKFKNGFYVPLKERAINQNISLQN